jgi:hypothetical protein
LRVVSGAVGCFCSAWCGRDVYSLLLRVGICGRAFALYIISRLRRCRAPALQARIEVLETLTTTTKHMEQPCCRYRFTHSVSSSSHLPWSTQQLSHTQYQAQQAS